MLWVLHRIVRVRWFFLSTYTKGFGWVIREKLWGKDRHTFVNEKSTDTHVPKLGMSTTEITETHKAMSLSKRTNWVTIYCLEIKLIASRKLVLYLHFHVQINGLNTFQSVDAFWRNSLKRLLKTWWPKVKLLIMSNFSFGHNVFNFV